MSLLYFHRSITSETYEEGNVDAGLWALGGGFRGLTSPIMWYYNGSTYGVGYENNATNNIVWITKQSGLTVTSTQVNNGTDGSEPENHPTPAIYINELTGYIYVIQNEFHVDRFGVWKSDAPEDISSFTFVNWFDTDGAYLTLNKFSGTSATFITRSGGSPSGYDGSLLEVDLDLPSGYQDTLLVECDYATNNSRFYPTEVHRYGTSDYYIGGSAQRDDALFTTFIRAIFITQDFETFENIGQTFSKNVPATAALTWSEWTTNFNTFGTDGVRSNSFGAGCLVQINDDIYTTIVTDTNEITIYKFTIGTAASVASIVLPYSISVIDSVYLYYNGQKLVTHFKDTDLNIRVGNIDTDLTTFTFIRNLDLPDGDYVGFPWNFDDVTGKYMIGSRSIIGDNGNVPYIITENKWN